MWRTKKLIGALLVLFLTMGTLLNYTPALAQTGTAVRVDPAVLSAQVNNTFDSYVRVDNVGGLTAYEIHLSFNAAVLEVVSIANGGFVVADFTVQNTFDNLGGTIDYAVAQLNSAPAQGSGALLKITFRAKANGSSPLTLRAVQAAPTGLLLADSNGMSIPAVWTAGAVTVGSGQGQTAVPPTATATATATAPVLSLTPTATSVITATATSTSVPTATTPPVSVGGGTHTVRWGESLYCIGRGYRVNPWSIAEVNHIWWPYFIFPGQKLTIPNVAWSPIPSGPVCQTQFVPTTPVPATPTFTPTATATGPTPTLTPVPVTPIPLTPIACRAYHTVRYGETLYRIGVNYGVPYEEIARVNQLANPRLIYVGQSLCIP